MIVVFFGQPHSGKSTLAKEFPTYRNIDGDTLRELFSNKDYSREGRIKNLNRASDIAHYLNSIGENVILSLVYPYKEARDYLNDLTNDVAWIYLQYNEIRGRENFHVKDFDVPTQEVVLHLDTTEVKIEECVNFIQKYIHEKILSHSDK
jgi:adenylylsulfate kinase-like enzyme